MNTGNYEYRYLEEPAHEAPRGPKKEIMPGKGLGSRFKP
jgi:hypothetical protein